MRGQKKDDFPRMDSAGVFADAVGGETLLTFIGTRAVHTGVFLYTRIRRSGSSAGIIFSLFRERS